ncbi:MAG: DUF2911 domain-containing protein [Acidobacteria bacterium]|jgi:hypothetical protein|nr:DUF2911 domain-containing protein [Acidobacteriota bacterium]
MKKTIYPVVMLTLLFASNALAQLNLPRESQRQEVAQTVGDTRIALVYHRPNTKAREVWGKLVPFGEVWRTGANENTTFETSQNLKINGQILPAGKYGFHTIPNKDEWTIIFSKVNDQWGSFAYKPENDQLRVTAKPQTVEMQETMSLGFENVKATTADVVVRWEKMRVPFTVDVGDVNERTLTEIRKQMTNLKADNLKAPVDAANYIYGQKMTTNYVEAIGWLDAALKMKETGNALGLKAYLLAETGKKTEALATIQRAITVAKAANPKANTSALEKRMADWKSGKWQSNTTPSM